MELPDENVQGSSMSLAPVSSPPSNHKEEERVCRVCRSGEEEGELFHPCLCTGSIRYVHQECLKQWLERSKKSKCELCKAEFTWDKVQKDEPPPGAFTLVMSIAKSIAILFLTTLRIYLVTFVWLVVFPFLVLLSFRWMSRVERHLLEYWNNVLARPSPARKLKSDVAFIVQQVIELVVQGSQTQLPIALEKLLSRPKTWSQIPPILHSKTLLFKSFPAFFDDMTSNSTLIGSFNGTAEDWQNVYHTGKTFLMGLVPNGTVIKDPSCPYLFNFTSLDTYSSMGTMETLDLTFNTTLINETSAATITSDTWSKIYAHLETSKIPSEIITGQLLTAAIVVFAVFSFFIREWIMLHGGVAANVGENGDNVREVIEEVQLDLGRLNPEALAALQAHNINRNNPNANDLAVEFARLARMNLGAEELARELHRIAERNRGNLQLEEAGAARDPLSPKRRRPTLPETEEPELLEERLSTAVADARAHWSAKVESATLQYTLNPNPDRVMYRSWAAFNNDQVIESEKMFIMEDAAVSELKEILLEGITRVYTQCNADGDVDEMTDYYMEVIMWERGTVGRGPEEQPGPYFANQEEQVDDHQDDYDVDDDPYDETHSNEREEHEGVNAYQPYSHHLNYDDYPLYPNRLNYGEEQEETTREENAERDEDARPIPILANPTVPIEAVPRRPGLHRAANQVNPVNPADAQPDAELEDLMDADEPALLDDMDGILEAIGFRGSIMTLFQNFLAMFVLFEVATLVLVWIPGIIGRWIGVDIWLLPISGVRKLSDPIFDGIFGLLSLLLSHVLGFLGLVREKVTVEFSPQEALQRLISPELPAKPLRRVIARVVGHFESFGYYDTIKNWIISLVIGYMDLIILMNIIVWASTRFRWDSLRVLREASIQFLALSKVVVFMVIEILIFPCACGFVLNYTFTFVFPTHPEKLSFNIPTLPALFLTWLPGTIFMFLFSSLIDRLRSHIRPGTLWFIRDPSSVEFNPIKEILDRGAWTQVRKIGVSAGMYGGAVWWVWGAYAAVGRVVGVWPIRLLPSERGFPLYLMYIRFLYPLVFYLVDVNGIFYTVYKYILHKSSHQLRLTSFFFNNGERVYVEEGYTKYKTWAAFFSNLTVDESLVEEKTQMVETSDLIWTRDGGFLRVPATDTIKIKPARTLYIQTDAVGRPLTDRGAEIIAEQTEEIMHTRKKDRYAIVYSPPRLRWRVAGYFGLVWFGGLGIWAGGVVLPLVIGRTIFWNMTVNDLDSFNLGVLLLSLCYSVYRLSQMPLQTHAVPYKIISATILGAFVLPTLFGITLSFYLSSQIPYLKSDVEDIPTIFLIQSWGYGLVLQSIFYSIPWLAQGVGHAEFFESVRALVENRSWSLLADLVLDPILKAIAWTAGSSLLPFTLALIFRPLCVHRGIPIVSWKTWVDIVHSTIFRCVALIGLYKGLRVVLRAYMDRMMDEDGLEHRVLRNYVDPKKAQGKAKRVKESAKKTASMPPEVLDGLDNELQELWTQHRAESLSDPWSGSSLIEQNKQDLLYEDSLDFENLQRLIQERKEMNELGRREREMMMREATSSAVREGDLRRRQV